MSVARRFDHDEARRRRAAGESYSSIARDVGVTVNAVMLVCDPAYRERQRAYQRNRLVSTCEDCGGPCVKNWYTGIRLDRVVCRRCSDARARVENVAARRDDQGRLYCSTCDSYKDESAFRVRRGLPHWRCRSCETARRREHRRRKPDLYAAANARQYERRVAAAGG